MEPIVLFICQCSKMYKFKAKDTEIKPCPLCLGNISKGFTLNNMKKKKKKKN